MTEEDVLSLIEETKEPSFRMPSGLTREERHEWAEKVASLSDEDRFIVSVQDFITSRGKKRGISIDTSGTFEEFHDRMSNLQHETLLQSIQKLEKELGLESVQVEGETKEERIKFMQDLFNKYNPTKGE